MSVDQEVQRNMLTLQDAGAALGMSAEAIRRRIKRGEIKARFDRGSPKLGYLIDRDEYVRYLRSIGEDWRADLIERGVMPKSESGPRISVLN